MTSDPFKQLVERRKSEVSEIEPEKVHRKLKEDQSIMIIDVRENKERQEAAIPHSKHLNRGILERDIDEAISDKEQQIILYCGGGKRSTLAAYNLEKMGYGNVYSMRGGFRAWKNNDLPTV